VENATIFHCRTWAFLFDLWPTHVLSRQPNRKPRRFMSMWTTQRTPPSHARVPRTPRSIPSFYLSFPPSSSLPLFSLRSIHLLSSPLLSPSRSPSAYGLRRPWSGPAATQTVFPLHRLRHARSPFSTAGK